MNKLVFTWEAPASNGSSPITKYEVEVGIDGDYRAIPVTVPPRAPLSLEYYVTGLSLGDTRWVRVRAVTDVGNSPWAMASDGQRQGPRYARSGDRTPHLPRRHQYQNHGRMEGPQIRRLPQRPRPQRQRHRQRHRQVRYSGKTLPLRWQRRLEHGKCHAQRRDLGSDAVHRDRVRPRRVITWIRVRAVNALYDGPWTEYIGISMNP